MEIKIIFSYRMKNFSRGINIYFVYMLYKYYILRIYVIYVFFFFFFLGSILKVPPALRWRQSARRDSKKTKNCSLKVRNKRQMLTGNCKKGTLAHSAFNGQTCLLYTSGRNTPYGTEYHTRPPRGPLSTARLHNKRSWLNTETWNMTCVSKRALGEMFPTSCSFRRH